MSQTTITVSERTLERFKSLKAELDDVQDAPDHTNESFLQSLMDTWEAADDGYYDDGIDTSEIVECQQQTIEELEQQRDMLTELLEQSVSLEASERAQIAREVVGALQ